MLSWMKRSSSKKTRLSGSRKRGIFSKSARSMSLSSIPDLDASMNLDLDDVNLEDSFSTTKSSSICSKSKWISRRIICMFQRSKDASKDGKKNRSTASLLDESLEDGVEDQEDREDEENFPESEEESRTRRCRKTLNKILLLRRRKSLSKRTPLDEYAKRKLQISVDSGWAGSSPSSSLSSLVNDEAFSASSPITKNIQKERRSSKPRNSGAIVRRKSMMFPCRELDDSLRELSRSAEDLTRLGDEDSSSSFSDSGFYVSCNSSNDGGESGQDIADKSGALKFARSIEDFARNVKSCDNCALISRGEKKSTGESSEKLSSCIASNFEELAIVKRCKSASCVFSNRESASENTECSSEKLASGESQRTRELDESLERHRFVRNDFRRRTRPWISKSTVELLEEDPSLCHSDVEEFNSMDDLLCSDSRYDEDEDHVFRFEEKLKDEDDLSNTEVQSASINFGYEDENESGSFNSFNSSYVITMYV